MRWIARALLVLLIVDLFYLAVTWPDWKKIAAGPVPRSKFMADYQHRRAREARLPSLQWSPVPLSTIPKYLVRAVVVAEDSRFYEHSGFDLIAFKEAMEYNWEEGRLAFGASTISQQTVKNLFLSASRNPMRKWHELILTWGMEHNLTKQRIMEIYLNDAQFGEGVYGVQAAARAYWGIDVSQLAPEQAAELAATLPAPTKNNPATRTRQFENRARKIFDLLTKYPGNAAESMARLRLEQDTDSPDTGDQPAPPGAGAAVLPPVEDRGAARGTM
jgi:monofunctional biosynthetic peptidoglycan transglycosylase